MNDNRYAVSSHAAPLTQANCLFKRQTYKNLLGGGNRDENIVLKESSLVKLQSHTITSHAYSSQVNTASMRNALGDIGNRIRLGLAPANKELAKPAENAPETGSNNSCIMLEEEEDNEVEEIELDEQSMHESIVDIDECDAENSQLVADYVKEIYKYLNETEKKFRIRPNFLEAKIVTVKMRSVLVDWLIQVHLKFHLLQETLYLCVQIIDAYLQVSLGHVTAGDR